MNQVQKKYVILGSLCALVLTLAVGYAAFSTILNINGTSNINSDWNVQITGIELFSSSGATDNAGSPSYDNTNGLSATFNTNLVSPGDYATYKIEITNKGSIDAKLTNITMPENTNNDIIFYLNKDQDNQDITGALKQNDTLYKSDQTGNVGYVYVTVLYKDYEGQTTLTGNAATASMTISFDFEQATGNNAGTSSDNSPTVYAYHTDVKRIGIDTVTDGVTDYTQLSSYKAGKTWFLKYDLDSSRLIQNAYACVKYSFISDPVCLQGWKDSEGNSYYASNKAILEGLQKTFENPNNRGNCYLYSSNSSCSSYGESLISANSDGIATAKYSGDTGCYVGYSFGAAYCYE